MPTIEIKIRPLAKGFIVSHCEIPEAPTPNSPMPMSPYIEEFAADDAAVQELVAAISRGAVKAAPTGKEDREAKTVVHGPGLLNHTVIGGTKKVEGYFE